MQEKVMPHNLEAEQSVLGSMFLSKYAVQKAVESLTSDLFYSDRNAKIFDAISTLTEKGKPVDLTTVATELEDRKLLKQIGDIE